MSQSRYDPAQLSFFSCLGVTYYLLEAVVFAALRALRGITAAGSNIVFDYMDADSFVPGKVAQRTALMHARARLVGEPMQSGFDFRLTKSPTG